MLEIMNYMYNNIENLNKCNHSTNKKVVTDNMITIKDLPGWFVCGNKNGAIKTTA